MTNKTDGRCRPLSTEHKRKISYAMSQGLYNEAGEKRCSKCTIHKPLAEYYYHLKSHGYEVYPCCKKCHISQVSSNQDSYSDERKQAHYASIKKYQETQKFKETKKRYYTPTVMARKAQLERIRRKKKKSEEA